MSATIRPQVGPYSLVRRIAIGGMGEVFLAKSEREGTTRNIALKRILPHLVTERHFDRFVDDSMMTSLDHPNILLPSHTWGLYMVMEYLAGKM